MIVMAKISKGHGDTYTEHELSAPFEQQPVPIRRAMLGGGDSQSVDGKPSQTSSRSGGNADAEQQRQSQKPAPETENLSGQQDQGGDSGASSAGTSGQTTDLDTPDDDYADTDYKALQALCRDREISAKGTRDELIERLREWDSKANIRSTDEFDDFE